MTATARNIAIILGLAAAVAFIPGGGSTANITQQAVYLVFLATLVWFASIQYRQHKTSLYSLGDTRRAVLYVAIAVGAVTLTAKARLWATTAGEFVWLVLLAGCVYALIAVVISARKY